MSARTRVDPKALISIKSEARGLSGPRSERIRRFRQQAHEEEDPFEEFRLVASAATRFMEPL